METEKLVDISFVFRIWEFEMIFGRGRGGTMWDALQFK